MSKASRPRCDAWRAERCVQPTAVQEYGDRPSAGVCRQCDHYEGPPRGLGDVIHTALGLPVVRQIVKAVKPDGCGPCAERRKRLNGVK